MEYVCDGGQANRYSLIFGQKGEFDRNKDIYQRYLKSPLEVVLPSCVGDFEETRLYVL